MKNLKVLSDDQLIQDIKNLVHQERERLTDILHHLKEIDRRRLFSTLKFSSLYEYCTKALGYSEDQAYRRIQAMRLLCEIPEIEIKINNGSLSLSHLGMAQSLFAREEKTNNSFSRTEKLELLEKFENTSKREAERIVIAVAPEPSIVPDKIKEMTNEKVELRFSADRKLVEKIERLKGLLAHKKPQISLGELFEDLCDLGLEKWDKSQVSAPARDASQNQSAQENSPSGQTRAATIRDIWRKSKGRCENCHGQYALEVDHVVPKAAGGGDVPENLRLLCRKCNQRSAIEWLGENKMARFLNR